MDPIWRYPNPACLHESWPFGCVATHETNGFLSGKDPLTGVTNDTHLRQNEIYTGETKKSSMVKYLPYFNQLVHVV